MRLTDNPRIMRLPKDERDWTAFIRELEPLMARDWYFEVAAGNVPGYRSVNKFGLAPDVDTAIADIWDGSATTKVWVAPTQARVHSIASTSATDGSSSTGAASIQVYGLTDWDTPEVSEVVTSTDFNGTPVNTANSYVIIHRMKVTVAGSSGPNVGVITATAATDGTVTAQILAGEGQTQMAIYGISSKDTAYMTSFYSNVLGNTTTVSANINLLYAFQPDVDETVFQVKHDLTNVASADNPLQHFYNPPNAFSGPGILKLQATGSTNNLSVSGGFDLVIGGQ